MRRFIRSCGFAISGIVMALRTQRHMRIHLTCAVLVTTAGLCLRLSRMEWAALVIVMGMVIAAELLNTAVESVVDLVSPGIHPLAKAAKDTAAGAVLVTAIAAIITGLLVLGPPLWEAIR
jgi:diacylglycerol kinase